MASHIIHDLFNDKTIYIIGGSREFLYFDIYELDLNGNANSKVPIDLSSLDEIEWQFAPYSVIKGKNIAIATKTLSSGDIAILRNSDGTLTNRIQVVIEKEDFEIYEGAFLHQLVITDGAGDAFVSFEGIIDVGRRIQK